MMMVVNNPFGRGAPLNSHDINIIYARIYLQNLLG